ncbi:MAG: class I SAM-dependent methyltransferase [Nanoarchaeota archaeon]|nr:class I SAM-dependent methyltransferase [Nanoarchaeota archaeon]MBU1004426.1 class I SAM-dependent methyltransferase [Nanoarchaeota archaeon]MBU1946687.1 class I SAM-dependent methyltransferase [Nanoarchaeota archaeon]
MKEWDKFHKKRTEKMGEEKPHPEVTKLVKTLKGNNCKKILDHGCGIGRNLFYLRQEGFEVYGIDNSDYALASLKKKNLPPKYIIHGDISKIPFEDNFFDTLISTNVLAHGNLKQIERYISEIKRVVKPGGIILLVVPSIHFFEKVKTKETKEISSGTYIGLNIPDKEIPRHYFTKEEMQRFFNNDKILKNEYIDEYSCFMKKTVNHLIFICQIGE